jgi:hypothetical protein
MRRLTQSTPNKQANKPTECSVRDISMRNPPRIGETFENPKKTQLGKEMKQKHLMSPLEKKGANWKTMKHEYNKTRKGKEEEVKHKARYHNRATFRIRIRERKVQDKAFSASRKVEKKRARGGLKKEQTERTFRAGYGQQ